MKRLIITAAAALAVGAGSMPLLQALGIVTANDMEVLPFGHKVDHVAIPVLAAPDPSLPPADSLEVQVLFRVPVSAWSDTVLVDIYTGAVPYRINAAGLANGIQGEFGEVLRRDF